MNTGHLSGATGRAFWQGLDQLVETPEIREEIDRRWPGLSALAGDWQRRDILKCLGGTLALAGLAGCEAQPDEEALPYVNPPQGTQPGQDRFYATAVELDGIGQPVIGKTREGRPIKLEGNPDHPASGGATDAFAQAQLLSLYDPDRSGAPVRRGVPTTWGAFAAALSDLRKTLDESGGSGLRLLTGPVGSPTLLKQITALRAHWPSMRWHVHVPLAGTRPPAAAPLDEVEAVVSFDDDVLGPGALQTINAQNWAKRRRAFQRGEGDALLYVAEPAPTLTGVAATDRLVAGPRRIPQLLRALSAAVGAEDSPLERMTTRERKWLEEATKALLTHRGRGLVTVGAFYAAEAQALAAAINRQLGNPAPTPTPASNPDAEGLPALIEAMRSGETRAVMVLGSNPAYSAAPDLGFADAYRRVPLRIHAGLHRDETAALSEWHLPLAHLLESWSDVCCADGSLTLVQPLVRPWLDIRSRHQLLAMLGGEELDGRALLRSQHSISDEDWQAALVSGLLTEDASASTDRQTMDTRRGPAESAREGLDLVIRPDPCIHDGQFADNPWLQELPKPLTKLTWDNAVHVSPSLAEREGLENEDLVELSIGEQSVTGPIWILPGLARDTVLVHLGYGRNAEPRISRGVGFDAYRLRSIAEPWHRSGATIRKLGRKYALASTQRHTTMAGHDFVRFVDAPGKALPPEPPRSSFYPPQNRTSPAWGMAIDLDLCIGCNACVSACVAENNIPMVGKDQVAMGREMHWLRVDRYYRGPPDDPEQVFQPVPCMHCENAPCEMGCPVNATVHSPDGLNLQVYNRCIGTRTCSAYCPYKVRRFNWLDYTHDDPPETRAARNPEVTVRARGVMEKCTYCIQRIEQEKIASDIEGRAMGEVKTACQQVCPTQAIVFGDIAQEGSGVSKAKESPRDYDLLPEANTRPRTTYAARVRGGKRKA